MVIGATPKAIAPPAGTLPHKWAALDFDQFEAAIRHEFVDESAIDPELFTATVEVTPEQAFEGWDDFAGFPLHDAMNRRTPSGMHQTRLPHSWKAGAIIYGVNGPWQMKPQQPQWDLRKNGWRKYETPVAVEQGKGSRACLALVPRSIQSRIFRRYYGDPLMDGFYLATAGDRPIDGEGLARAITMARMVAWATGYDDEWTVDPRDFWDELLTNHPNIPIVLTEGFKKAGAALTLGYAAIALVGVNGGYSRVDRENPHDKRIKLIDDMLPWATAGRRFILAFDQDEKSSTRRRVAIALSRFSKLLTQQDCTIAIAQWHQEQGKGLDDLIVQSGAAAAEEVIAHALSLEDWERLIKFENIQRKIRDRLGKFSINLAVDTPDLATMATALLGQIPRRGTVVIDAPTGTGKTNTAKILLEDVLSLIAPGNRESLQRGLAPRVGATYIADTDMGAGYFLDESGQPTLKISLCWDSIRRITERNYPPGSFDLLLDEVDQGFKHLLMGSTCGKDGKRPALQAKALYLITNARRVIMASAGVTDKEITLVSELRGETPYVVRNEHRSHGYHCRLFTDTPNGGDRKFARAAVLSELIEALEGGDRAIIHVDTRATSKLLEQLGIAYGLTKAQILRFDGDTTPEPLQQEFAANPNQFLESHSIRLLIASPSMTSGVSIQGDFFDQVFGFFEGRTISPADAMQSLHRYRRPVPRTVFAAAYGIGGKIPAFNALDYLGKSAERAALIDRSLEDVDLEGRLDVGTPTARYVAAIKAEDHHAMRDFGLYLRAYLEEGGHTVTWMGAPEETDPAYRMEEALQTLKDLRAVVRDQDVKALVTAKPITAEEAEKLRNMKALAYQQRQELERFNICEFYEMNPENLTEDFVIFDAKGKTRKGYRALSRLLIENAAAAQDEHQIDRLKYWKEPIAPHDLPSRELERRTMVMLGVMDAIAMAIKATISGEGWSCTTPWVCELLMKFKPYRRQVKLVLGFTFGDDITPTRFLGLLLRSFGGKSLTTTCRQLGGRYDRERVYMLDPDSLKKAQIYVSMEVKRKLKDSSNRLYTHELTYLLVEKDLCIDGPDPLTQLTSDPRAGLSKKPPSITRLRPA